MAATIQKIQKPTKYRAVDTSTSQQTVSANLIINGDFTGTDGDPIDDITGWSEISVGAGETQPVIKSNAAFIDVEDNGYIGIGYTHSFIAGVKYRVTISAKAESGDTGAWIRFQDNGDGTTNAIRTSYEDAYRHELTTSYQTFTTTWTADADSVQLLIVRDAIPDSEAEDWEYYVDNVTMVRLDSFGNNNHGQIYSGRALEFDGVSDYLTADSIASLGDSNFTAAMWINPTLDGYTGGPGGRVLFGFHDGSYNNRLFWYIAGSNNILRGYTASGIDSSNTSTALTASWQRLVLVKEGTSIKYYRNGVADGVSTLADTISGCAKFSIGQEWDSTTASDFYLGMMSDFQIWDSLWTQSDVTFDYLNPESLALNNSGTSLTESNLKLWYPMQDGHRGQQSYVLDGAGTGTKDVLSGYGTFTDASKWTVHANADANNYWTIDTSAQTMRIVSASDSTYIDASFHDTTILEVGQTYKITVEVTDATSGAIRIVPRSGGNNQTSYSAINTVGTHEFYYASAEKTNIAIGRHLEPTDITIKNLTVEAVNDKHHATTVFYGDDKVANGDCEVTDFTTVTINSVACAALGSSTVTGSTAQKNGGAKSLKVLADGDSAWPGIRWAGGDEMGLIIGRTYYMECYVFGNSGGDLDRIQLKYRTNDGTGVSIGIMSTLDGTWQKLSGTFVIPDDITDIQILAYEDGSTDDIPNTEFFYIDDILLKEVGTASGWTDADQQLDIPQTALQSYNQLAWFDGKADYVSITDNPAFTFGSGGTNDSLITISAWIYMNDATDFPILGKFSGTGREWLFTTYSDDKLYLQLYDESADTYIGRRYNAVALTSREGEWLHVVATYSGNEESSGVSLYINGESVDDADYEDGSYVGMEDLGANIFIGGNQSGDKYANGCITEVSLWGDELTQAEVNELYNDGKALHPETHSVYLDTTSKLQGYWRNNGLATWTDLTTAFSRDGTPQSLTETLLLPAGVDASRDNQGFIMNRQKDTNSLNLASNLLASGLDDGPHAKVKHIDLGTSDFSVCFWVYKLRDWTDQYIVSQVVDDNNRWYIRGSNDSTAVLNLYAKSQDIDSGSDYVILSDKDTTDLEANHLDKWLHVVCTVDRSDTSNGIQWYLNGSATTNGGVNSGEGQEDASLSLAADLTIGWNEQGGQADHHFDGMIDDFLIYSDILSADEVDRIHKAGKRSHR